MVDMLTVLPGILAGVLAVAFCKQRFKGWKLLRLLVAIARYTRLRGVNENKNKNKNKNCCRDRTSKVFICSRKVRAMKGELSLSLSCFRDAESDGTSKEGEGGPHWRGNRATVTRNSTTVADPCSCLLKSEQHQELL